MLYRGVDAGVLNQKLYFQSFLVYCSLSQNTHH